MDNAQWMGAALEGGHAMTHPKATVTASLSLGYGCSLAA